MFSHEKKRGFAVINGDNALSFRAKADLKSRSFLYFSIFLLATAFIVIFLVNLDFFSSMQQEAGNTMMDWIIFLIGGVINFFCVPILYWSSFDKFKKEDGFWDTESFWILPLFFFGSFFQYISSLPYTMVILPFSLLLIFFVHIWVMIISRNAITMDEQFENTVEYFKSITYLTAYYLIISVVVVFFDLFGKFRYWIG